jgi:Ca2+-binding EF-hand superfamily protein
MQTTPWTKMLAAAGLGMFTVAATANAQNAARPAAAPPATARPADAPNLADGDLPGPIDNPQDLEDTGKMLFKLADTNNDGQISQKEATDAGNLLVGGFFFRADQNGDGTVSKEEAQAAREALFRQQPLLRFVVQRGKAGLQQANNGNNNANPAASIANLLDTNNDKQLQATEVRQAVQTGVQGLFATADTNRDGQMSPSEINAAIVGVGKTVARAGFQAADSDNNGQVSKAEFDKAIVEPANVVFTIFDANNDGQISPQELQTAEQLIASQLRNLQVPDPANSPANLIGSGRTPGEVAPVPNIRTPEEGGARPGTAAPAPAQPR